MRYVDPSEIIFTSAASESNTLAIVGYALANEHRSHHVYKQRRTFECSSCDGVFEAFLDLKLNVNNQLICYI